MLGLRHAGKFDRCVILGDHGWEKWMTKLGKSFFTVKYFDRGQREAAWRWLMQPAEHADGAGFLNTVSGYVRRNLVVSLLIVGALVALLVGQMNSPRSDR
jgi:hypothetical protein